MSLSFTKMHGLGNDFVVIDDLTAARRSSASDIDAKRAQLICDRRLGIGADQILWLKKPDHRENDAKMDILNADGSVAEMCGNGVRAAGLYLYRSGEKRDRYRIETLAGVKVIEMKDVRPGHESIRVDMGPPTLGAYAREGEPLEVQGQVMRFHEIGMGNPHAVFFVDDAERFPAGTYGPIIERMARFPNRTNVEFVEVRSPSDIIVRVWERGAGLTLACGTGACASAVAALLLGKAKGEVRVGLPGGELEISWREGEPVWMEGPATEVFRGELAL